MFFVWYCIYETKGLSLEQVDELSGKVTKAWLSTSFVPTVSFAEMQDMGLNTRTQSLADLEAGVDRKKSITHVDGQDVTAENH